MKLILSVILVVLAIAALAIAAGFLYAAWDFYADYGYSTQTMGNKAYGFYSGFGMMGLISMLLGGLFGILGLVLYKSYKKSEDSLRSVDEY